MKTVKIVVTDTNKGVINIPLTRRQIGDLFDLQYMASDGTIKMLKRNKCDKSFWEFSRKIEKVLDCLHEGKCYQYNDKTKKLVLAKHKLWYCGKAPRWKK